MPYMIASNKSGYYVYSQDEQGKPTGEPHNQAPYKTKQEAMPLLRALYAAMKKSGEATAELDVTVLGPSGAGLEQVLSQADVNYTEQSLYADKRCALCVFWNGAGCYIVASLPKPVIAQGYCDEFAALDVMYPVGGSMFEAPEVTNEMSSDLPIAKGDPTWDAGEARAHIWTWATNDQGELDEAKAAQAFLIRDGEGKDGLKDPIADVVDGHLEVIPAALRAAASRLPQTDANGKSGAARVLEHYKKKAGIGEEMTSEMVRAAHEITVYSEYKGRYPEVPDAPGVDKAALTAGDNNPTFVIRPIAQVGRTSKNGIQYDQALIDSIREQINGKRPGGIFGHIKPEDRSTAHPQPQAYWIGAIQQGDTLWAKAYIADMERAKDIRRKKALGSADGTSIYGIGDQIPNPDGSKRLTNFVLESLDFAPLDRASLDMGAEMYVTSEQTNTVPAQIADSFVQPTGQAEPHPEDNDKDSEDMTPEEIRAMPDGELCEMLGSETAQRVANHLMAQNKMKMVAAEMETVPPSMITEMQAQQTVITELQAYKQGAQRREFEAVLDQAVGGYLPYRPQDDKQKAVLAEARAVLVGDTTRALGDNLDTTLITETVKQVVEAHPALMEMTRNTMLGPSVFMAREDNRQPSDERYYNGVDVNDPAVQQAARIKYGI